MKDTIYENGLMAFSFFIITLLSVCFPLLLSVKTETPYIISISLFINSLCMSREYLPLLKYKKVSKLFWFERLLGITISGSIALYSVIEIILMAYKVESTVFFILNTVASALFLIPCIIAFFEGILFIKQNYKESVVDRNQCVVTKGSTIDV